MEKLWIDGEEGRYALEELRSIPGLLGVLKGLGAKHMLPLQARILDTNMLDPAKDRQMVINMSELAGARGMLLFLLRELEEPKKGKH